MSRAEISVVRKLTFKASSATGECSWANSVPSGTRRKIAHNGRPTNPTTTAVATPVPIAIQRSARMLGGRRTESGRLQLVLRGEREHEVHQCIVALLLDFTTAIGYVATACAESGSVTALTAEPAALASVT